MEKDEYRQRKIRGKRNKVMSPVEAAIIEKKEEEAFFSVKKAVCEAVSQKGTEEIEWHVKLEEWWYGRLGQIYPAKPVKRDWSGRCDCVICLYPVRDGYCLYDPIQEEVPSVFVVLMEICSKGNGFAMLLRSEYERRMKGQLLEMLHELESGKEQYVRSEMSAESLKKNAKFYQVVAVQPVKIQS